MLKSRAEIVLGMLIATAVMAVVAIFYADQQLPSADAAQISAAISARYMIGLTALQIVVGAAGLLGLYLTVTYSRQSADAAIGAAASAARSARLSERTFSDLERPYVFIFGVRNIKFDYSGDGPFEWISYEIANYGKMPAIIEHPSEIVSVGVFPEAPLLMDQYHALRVSPVFAPSERRSNLRVYLPDNLVRLEKTDVFGEEIAVPKAISEGDFLLRIVVRYRGPSTSGHETSACFRWDEASCSMVQHGFDDFNYIR